MKTALRVTSQSRRSKWVIYPTVAVAFASFFAFVAIGAYLGGDALNGFTRAGHYFLCRHHHIQCVEVSRAIWRFSYWHAWVTIGSVLLVMAETALFVNTGDIELAERWR